MLLSPRTTPHVPRLSPREREIIRLMAKGLTAQEIANQREVSVEAVRTHVRSIARKLRRRNH